MAPCLSRTRPNLVVFLEDSGLLSWFGGPRALLARGASDVATAFNAMYVGWAPAADAYRERFPGISAARGLTLALGDVAWRSMDRTFGGIAKRYGVHVITSANVPYVRREDAPLLRDPAAPRGDLAYVATGRPVSRPAGRAAGVRDALGSGGGGHQPGCLLPALRAADGGRGGGAGGAAGGVDGRGILPVSPALARQVRPAVAAHGAGWVVVAWQEETTGPPSVLRVAVSADGGELALVWMDFREGLAAKVRIARSVDGGSTWGASMRVDAGGVEASHIEGMQAQPALTWTGSALAVAWVDDRERDWQVWAAVAPRGSTSGAVFANLSTKWTSSSTSRPEGASGSGFPTSEKVSPLTETEVLVADPVLTAGPEGTLILAWEDLRARRGHRDIRFARWSAGAGWTSLPGLKGGADDESFVSRFRPSVTRVGEDVRAVFQDLTPGKNALYSVTVPRTAGAPAVMPERLDDTGGAANQLTRPRLVSTGNTSLLFFEDDRSGWSRIRMSR